MGLIESLLTAEIVDGMTDTKSNKMRECMAQGIGNIVVELYMSLIEQVAMFNKPGGLEGQIGH